LLAAWVALPETAPARAAPVVHEYITPNPTEDLELSATAFRGSMPAALDTPSGVVAAPDPNRAPSEGETAYGGSSTPNSTDATYRIDRDTTRPELVSYDDPFVPAITPFKRLYAFDTVDETLELVVRDKSLQRIPIDGAAGPGDDQFFGDMSVDLDSASPVRVPTVGPGARVLRAQTEPQVRFELLRDGAENWFIRAETRQRVRLTLHLAIQRKSFGSSFPDVAWSDLEREAAPLPRSVHRAAQEVAAQIGITRALGARGAVSALVQYFRAFSPSEQRPQATSGVALYKELSLSQKGVCRHRAYAFVITALGLGIPARLIRNEAHAWVEVSDSRTWHRIDLGGAAGRLDFERDPGTQLHEPPADPYRWPTDAESGRDMAERSLSGQRSGGTSGGATGTGTGSGTDAPQPAEPPTDPPEPGSDSRPAPAFALSEPGGDVRRGAPLQVAGRVEADGSGCSFARIDVALRSADGRLLPLGALATDDAGRFAGSVTVALTVPVGDYDVVVSTPGDSRCGPGSSAATRK
jgi:hypothetical protein